MEQELSIETRRSENGRRQYVDVKVNGKPLDKVTSVQYNANAHDTPIIYLSYILPDVNIKATITNDVNKLNDLLVSIYRLALYDESENNRFKELVIKALEEEGFAEL